MITVTLTTYSEAGPNDPPAVDRTTVITIADTPDQAASIAAIASVLPVFWGAMSNPHAITPQALQALTDKLNAGATALTAAVNSNPLPTVQSTGQHSPR